jgi:hypothetical protein
MITTLFAYPPPRIYSHIELYELRDELTGDERNRAHFIELVDMLRKPSICDSPYDLVELDGSYNATHKVKYIHHLVNKSSFKINGDIYANLTVMYNIKILGPNPMFSILIDGKLFHTGALPTKMLAIPLGLQLITIVIDDNCTFHADVGELVIPDDMKRETWVGSDPANTISVVKTKVYFVNENFSIHKLQVPAGTTCIGSFEQLYYILRGIEVHGENITSVVCNILPSEISLIKNICISPDQCNPHIIDFPIPCRAFTYDIKQCRKFIQITATEPTTVTIILKIHDLICMGASMCGYGTAKAFTHSPLILEIFPTPHVEPKT